MLIRKIKPSDEPQLLRLLHEFYVEFNREKLFTEELLQLEAYKNTGRVVRKTAKNYIRKKKYSIFVAEERGGLAGYIYGVIKSRPHKVFGKEGYIEDWFVRDEFRNRKVGKDLFDKLLAEFRKKGCSHIATDTYAINKRAIDIYHKLGFGDFVLKLAKKL